MSRQQLTQNWRQKGGEDFERWRGWQRRSERGGAERQDGEDYFVVLHFRRYEGDAPPLHAPSVLGCFSVDSERNIRFDDSMMPVLSTKYIPDGEFKKVDMDLNKGCHRVNSFTGTSGDAFKHLLHWILKNQDGVRAKDDSERLEADFVCSRRLLKQIMQAPYTNSRHNFAEWVMLAKYFKGTIYLTRDIPEQDTNEEESHSRGEIYNYKFEQLVTGGNPDDVLEPNCQFRCALRLHVNKNSLLFAPDIDAVDPTRHKDDFKDMSSFVRLKVAKDSSNPNADQFYKRYVLNGWWIDNKVTGVPRLLVGKRSPEGVVHTLQMLQTDDFPSMAQGEWEPSVSINVLDKFLDFVKRRVVMEPDVVHRFEKSAPALRNIVHTCDPNVKDILPSWYKEQLFAPRSTR